MTNELVLEKTVEFVKLRLTGEGSGHDWWHVYRVWKNAVTISKTEKVDQFIVELGALLHDVADWKFHNGDDEMGAKVAKEWLEKLNVDNATVAHVCEIVKNVSFKGLGVISEMKTAEGRVVQDADRLDAIGAIGIARTFAYGGSKGREMYNPDIQPEMHTSFEQYKTSKGTTLNHFYEKLLHLRGLMNTNSAKLMAEERHRVMESFLIRFFQEWEGEC